MGDLVWAAIPPHCDIAIAEAVGLIGAIAAFEPAASA